MSVVSSSNPQSVTGLFPLVGVRFNDAVKADVESSARYRLPQDVKLFARLALDFRNQENLVNATLIKFQKEVIRNSARMFSAQDYVSGRGGEFESAVLEQARDGVFRLSMNETEIKEDQEIGETQDIAGSDRRVRLIVEKILDSNGEPLRKESPLTAYGIQVAQFTISDVNPEPKFQEMLSQQRDSAARASIERQQAKTEGLRKLRIVAQGESEKIEKQIEETKKQIVVITLAKTEKKKAVIEKEVETIRLDTADLKAQQIERLAKAEAFKRKSILEADNALEIKLKTLERIHAGYAAALQHKQLVPSVVIGGSGDGGSVTAMNLIELMTAKFAKDLSADLEIPK